MNKYKLFCHTDLDGVGCVILAYLAFGRENVDVEYCDYSNVDEKVGEFFGWHDIDAYDMIFITDISINEQLAASINTLGTNRWRLFDHHATALWMNKYDWCEVKVNLSCNIEYSNKDGQVCTKEYIQKTSGTELFYNFLIYNNYISTEKTEISVIKNILRFVNIVRDYDTWRWKEELSEEEGIICKQVNDLFYIYGRDKFVEWAINQIKYTICGPNIGVKFPLFSNADRALLEQKQKDIDIYVAEKDKQLTALVDGFGRIYGVVFAERYFSELGNRLCELHPKLRYVMMIDISNGKVSYRSSWDDIDLGELAHSFGGGGHKKAAGSTFDELGAMLQVVNWLNGGING